MVSRRKVISSPHRRPISPLTTLPPTFRLAAQSSAIPQPFLKCLAPPSLRQLSPIRRLSLPRRCTGTLWRSASNIWSFCTRHSARTPWNGDACSGKYGVLCGRIVSRGASRFYRPGCAYNGLQLVGFRAAVDKREILDIERFGKTGDGATRYFLGCRPRTSAGRFRIICNSSNLI